MERKIVKGYSGKCEILGEKEFCLNGTCHECYLRYTQDHNKLIEANQKMAFDCEQIEIREKIRCPENSTCYYYNLHDKPKDDCQRKMYKETKYIKNFTQIFVNAQRKINSLYQ